MDLATWAELVVIPDGLKLREPGSKHQKHIRLIQSLVMEARVNPSKDVYDSLKNVKSIECKGAKSTYFILQIPTIRDQ